eukprot:8865506-Pyramimonas_sp.AAC.1
MLARAIFAGSSRARVGGAALCNVVFGKCPSMLPPLEAGEGRAFASPGPGLLLVAKSSLADAVAYP